MAQVMQAADWDIDAQPWSDPYWGGDISIGAGVAIPVIHSCRSGNFKECPLHIWEMPIPNMWYTIAIDPSSGKEFGDPSAIQVVNNVGCQVAEMILRAADMDAQFKAGEWLGHFYNEAKVVVEVNSFGVVLFKMFDMYNYPNLYVDRGSGWTTSVRTRSLMVGTMREALLGRRQILRSKRLKRELLAFTDDVRTNEVEDDLTTAMMIAYQCK